MTPQQSLWGHPGAWTPVGSYHGSGALSQSPRAAWEPSSERAARVATRERPKLISGGIYSTKLDLPQQPLKSFEMSREEQQLQEKAAFRDSLRSF